MTVFSLFAVYLMGALNPAVSYAQTIVPAGSLNVSETWTLAGSPYDVQGILTVPASVTLIIESGVTVTFPNNGKLDIFGALYVDGTEAGPVTITGPVWDGLRLRPAATGNLSYLSLIESRNGLTLEVGLPPIVGLNVSGAGHAGSISIGVSQTFLQATIASNTGFSGGSLTFEDCVFARSGQLVNSRAITSSRAFITRCVFYNFDNAITNVHMIEADFNTFLWNETALLAGGAVTGFFRNNIVSSTDPRSIVYSNGAGPTQSILDARNNIFDVSSPPASEPNTLFENPLLSRGASGAYEPTSRSGAVGGASDGTDIGAAPYAGQPTAILMGHLRQDLVLSAAGSPHIIPGDLIVEPGVTLTIEPGATLRAAPTDGMRRERVFRLGYIRGTRVGLVIKGRLLGLGTPTNRIIFEADGVIPAMGAWDGLEFSSGSTAAVDQATIRHALMGLRSAGGPASTVRNTIFEDNDVGLMTRPGVGGTNFQRLTIRDSGRNAIELEDGSQLELRNSLIHHNAGGIRLLSGLLTTILTLDGNSILENAGFGVAASFLSDVSLVTLQDNIIAGNYAPVSRVNVVSSHHNLVPGTRLGGFELYSSSPTELLENPLLVDPANRNFAPSERSGARFHASDGGTIGAVEYAGDSTPTLMGHLYTDTTWTASGGPYFVDGDLIVEPGVILQVGEGTEIRFRALADSLSRPPARERTGLFVHGTLRVDGTNASPVLFGSARGSPRAGDWSGIELNSSAGASRIRDLSISNAVDGVRSAAMGAQLRNVSVGDCSDRAIAVPAGDISIDGARLFDSVVGLAIGDASATVDSTLVYGNRDAGLTWTDGSGGHALVLRHLSVHGNGPVAIDITTASGVAPSSLLLRNSIISGYSMAGVRLGTGTPPVLDLGFNDVWSNAGTTHVGLAPAPTSLTLDPRFVDPAADDLQLLVNSPCVDSGDPASGGHDVLGRSRPIDGDGNGAARADIGAYEAVFSGNLPPLANAGNDQLVVAGGVVSFNGAGSSDPDGSIVGYQWDFGDGTNATGAMVSHRFVGGTNRTVTLMVTDNLGLSDQDAVRITVNLPPVANPGPPRFVEPGVPIVLSGLLSSDADGTLVAYQWDLGDGTTAVGATITKVYPIDGTFTVQLTVADNLGASHSAFTVVRVGLGSDAQPPTIIHTPNAGALTAGTSQRIIAQIQDASQVATGTIYYRTQASTNYTSLSMSTSGGDLWLATIPGSAIVAPGLDYYFSATDSALGANSGRLPAAAGQVFTVSVITPPPPAITHAPWSQAWPEGRELLVEANLSAQAGVRDATVSYRVAGGGFVAVPAVVSGSTWTARIPASAVLPPHLDYRIEARDQLMPPQVTVVPSSSTTYRVVVTPTDRTPPQLSLLNPPQFSVLGRAVTVTASASDPGGVSAVEVRFRTRGQVNFQVVPLYIDGARYRGEIPAAEVGRPALEWYVVARDASSRRNQAVVPPGGAATPVTTRVTPDFNVSPGDLIVTEILADPTGDETVREWFEVHNTSTSAIDLDGFSFEDERTDGFEVAVQPVTVGPGAYIVLGRSGDMALNGGVSVDQVFTGLALSNRVDALVIRAGPTIVDRVVWSSTTGFIFTPGRSLALDPNMLDAVSNDDGASWCNSLALLSSGDSGTPGFANEACQAAVDRDPPEITHIPLQDGQPEGLQIGVIATIRDASALTTLDLFYRSAGAVGFQQAGLQSIGEDQVQASLPAAEVRVGTMAYYLRVVDEFGNEALAPSGGASAPYNFLVTPQDRAGPSIQHVAPLELASNRAFVIDVEVSDPSGTSSVSVHYRTDGMAFSDLPTILQTPPRYRAVIPASAISGVQLEYYITAADSLGNTSSLPSDASARRFVVSLRPTDDEPPSLIHTLISEAIPEGVSHELVLDAADASGVAEVQVFVLEASTGNFVALGAESTAASEWSVTVPGSLVRAPQLSWYAEATDGSEAQNRVRVPASAPSERFEIVVEPAPSPAPQLPGNEGCRSTGGGTPILIMGLFALLRRKSL